MIKLLIVDDDIPIVDFLWAFFKEKKYNVSVAINGKEAISIVEKEAPHIILLDIKMPDMSGLEVLQRVKNINEEIKVIMMTAVSDDETIKIAKERGASDYIIKPFSLDYMEKEVIPKTLKGLT